MSQEHEIVQLVYEAKYSMQGADDLIGQYMPFIKSETSKFIKRPPQEGRDEELSVAMIAFHEAIQNYDREKGAFLPLASTLIRNRLIDHWRSNKKHQDVISIESSVYSDDEGETTIADQLEDDSDVEAEYTNLAATQAEIEELSKQMAEYDVSITDVAENCPKQERTIEACQQAIQAAKKDPSIIDDLLRTKRLPLKKIIEQTGVAKKTLERHRKYVIALLLIYSNGYEIIRGHLYEMQRGGTN